VIEIAEPFVETVSGGQELVAVPEMILAELRGGIARRLQHFCDRRIALLNSARRAGNTDGRHAGANGELSHDERSAAGRTTGLAIVIGEQHAGLAIESMCGVRPIMPCV